MLFCNNNIHSLAVTMNAVQCPSLSRFWTLKYETLTQLLVFAGEPKVRWQVYCFEH